MITQQEYAQRRNALIDKIGKNAIAILPAAPEYFRNGDNHYKFRQNSDFYYLTGFSEPEAVAIFIPGHENGEYLLFNRPRDAFSEIWYGRRAGQQGAVKNYGANHAYQISEFFEKIPELLLNRDTLYLAIGRNPEFDEQILNAINTLRTKVRSGVGAPINIINCEIILHEMRLKKSAAEIETMRKAAQISVAAHIRAMQICKPGMYEYQLEAEMLHEFFKQGCRSVAYDPIIGGGENTCILHYHENNTELKNGDLVLIDAGGEYQNYSSDITRTFPVNGKFSTEQKAIYEIVLSAQLAGIKQVHPGNPWPKIQQTMIQIITEGLVKLGILKGSVNDLIESKTYQTFYMHNSGHWLGLDTHDVGAYQINGKWRELAPGMVLTVEPGIYIAANTPNVDPRWWNVGVRIEDDVLVTKDGNDVLSAGLPKEIAEIESLMRA